MSRASATPKKLIVLALVFGLLAVACTPQGAVGLGTLSEATQPENAVQGSANAADTASTSELQSADDTAAADGAEVEFTGLVTSIGASEWIIGARTVQVTAQTEIKAGVALGEFVKVHAQPGADGNLVAREIEVEAPATGTPQPQPGAEQEFSGALTAIDGDLWTIGGQIVRITAATEVKGTLGIGDVLKVHASPGSDGVLLAREVELASGQVGDDDDGDDGDDNQAGEQEFTGVLSAINGDLWTIGGQQVRVTTSAEVKDSLQIGDLVKVHASLGSDGILLAREVELADDDDLNDDNSGPDNGDDDGDNDDNSGPGSGDDDGDNDDDNSGPGSGDDDGDNDDNSGPGSGDDDGDNDDDDDDDDNDDDDDDDNSGSGDDDDDDNDDDNSGGGGDD